jgi:dihydropyrimidinase
VISRGRDVVADGELKGVPGMGRWLGRTGGWAATPTGRLAPETDPATNFGASIL